MKEINSIVNFFDKLEDGVRGGLSRYPVIYSFFGSIGIVLVWRGIWHTADWLQHNTIIGSVLFSDVGSVLMGVLILLVTGLFVSVFIGDSIIITGVKHEKKLSEKTEDEIELEKVELQHMHQDLEDIKQKMN